jgi:hypothetical protein
MKSTISWNITLCSLLPPAFILLSSSTYSTLKMEAISSSETSADFQRTTRHYIPEDSTLHIHHCENLKSCKRIHGCCMCSLLHTMESISLFYSLNKLLTPQYIFIKILQFPVQKDSGSLT